MTDLVDNVLPPVDWPQTPAEHAEWERRKHIATVALMRAGHFDLLEVLGLGETA